ncbi:hypothetical protein AAFF_G00039350 [Aldrovandia affinis]|uniref:Uncharacterized protein n=1 Tax=Aldrovandia affinis TaxID=143900 RepID=A0AAD7S2Y9_9TELE|nr:hypothetical protein AAFF_G00039350 [Aldrovandia affinis]
MGRGDTGGFEKVLMLLDLTLGVKLISLLRGQVRNGVIPRPAAGPKEQVCNSEGLVSADEREEKQQVFHFTAHHPQTQTQ